MWNISDNELYTGGKAGTSKKKVLFTMEEISEVLHHHHSNAMGGGHSGVNATLDKISNYYCWNGMKEDIQEYVSLINKYAHYAIGNLYEYIRLYGIYQNIFIPQ